MPRIVADDLLRDIVGPLAEERDVDTLRQISLLLERENQRLIAKNLQLTAEAPEAVDLSRPRRARLTYWYIEPVPELLAHATTRLAAHVFPEVRDDHSRASRLCWHAIRGMTRCPVQLMVSVW